MFLEQKNQYIRMISEGSCDTEDWMLKIQLTNYILKCIQIENTFVNITALSAFLIK